MLSALNDIFGIHEQALLIREKRAQMIAHNLANVDTPNYKARDLDFKKAISSYNNTPSQLQNTQENHIENNRLDFFDAVSYRLPFQTSLDGNTVDKNLEVTTFARNAQEYQASLSFLNGKLKTIMSALKGE